MGFTMSLVLCKERNSFHISLLLEEQQQKYKGSNVFIACGMLFIGKTLNNGAAESVSGQVSDLNF